jgi:hypothetical protein
MSTRYHETEASIAVARQGNISEYNETLNAFKMFVEVAAESGERFRDILGEAQSSPC